MQLAIAFQDGFEDDTVVVLVDGAEAYRADGLTTRTQISHAGDTTLEVPESARVEVAVPTQGLRAPVELRPNVGVAVMDGALTITYPEQLGFA